MALHEILEVKSGEPMKPRTVLFTLLMLAGMLRGRHRRQNS